MLNTTSGSATSKLQQTSYVTGKHLPQVVINNKATTDLHLVKIIVIAAGVYHISIDVAITIFRKSQH